MRSRTGLRAIGALVVAFGADAALGQTLPMHGDAIHLGVASCASSRCHGSGSPTGASVVRQDEVTIWQQRDKHSLAFQTLGNAKSKEMARELGLPAADSAKECLVCHADPAPAHRRGPQFQLSDGVGCEACHGGASGWIEVHTVNDNAISHARNVAAGLYPTDRPAARADLCLTCHYGVSHRVYGAGHPTLSFELDTFTAIEPAHFDVDEDYVERKQPALGVQVWGVGQARSLVSMLDLALDPVRGRAGVFPELSLMDCNACHKSKAADSWQERASLGLGPGVVRFKDANVIMLRVALGVIDPPLGKEMAARGRALHRASQKGWMEWLAAARALRQTAIRAGDIFRDHDFTADEQTALLAALVKEGSKGEYVDYVAAEQTAMAIGATLQTLRGQDRIGEAEFERVTKVMNDLYATVQNDERYRPTATLAALRRIQSAAR